MAIKQVINLIRLLGLRRGARMKRRHEAALPLIRGYAATTCFWTLLKTGFLDALAAAGAMSLREVAGDMKLDAHVLESICSYLDGAGLMRYDEASGQVSLTRRGRDLLAEPRGLFELLYAYEPVFVELESMLRGTKRYGAEVRRRTDWVGIGSGRLCRQLPYPVMIDMVARHGRLNVLDLGCGDGALLSDLARKLGGLRGTGVEIDAQTAELANRQFAEARLDDRLSAHPMDMFELAGGAPPAFGRVDCLTACDTFHEYLWDGDGRVVKLLADLRAAFPAAVMVVGEFCKQSHESLRRRPTAFLEHHLFHQLTNQRIESAARWREIFAAAGLRILEEKVFDLVGHGYFVLE